MRFFFCRFLSEYAAGLLLMCIAVPRHSIWIFTFQKFRLEDNAVKYAPRKVYIRESGGYVELSFEYLTEEKFCSITKIKAYTILERKDT